MERFSASFMKNNATGKYLILLDFVQGRGDDKVNTPLAESRELDESEFLDKYEKTRKFAETLNNMMAEKRRNERIDPDQIHNPKNIKNINSIIVFSEIHNMLAFFNTSNLDLTEQEEKSLCFMIFETVFSLEKEQFEAVKGYVYPQLDLKEEEYVIALENLRGKALSINQLLECYLIERHGLEIEEILFPIAVKSKTCTRKFYDDFMDHGFIDGYSIKDEAIPYVPDSIETLDATVKAISESILAIISLKAEISVNKLRKLIPQCGERVITKSGFSISKERATNSEKKLLRAYNMTYRDIEIYQIEMYLLYVLCLSDSNTA